MKSEEYLESIISRIQRDYSLREYVKKKLGMTEEDFEEILALPEKHFSEYPNNNLFFNHFSSIIKLAKKFATYNYK